MSATFDRHGFDKPALFLGHPFGGLPREDRFGNGISLDDKSSERATTQTASEADDAGGFDFHLGVYSRF
jgi:hypothetical protein